VTGTSLSSRPPTWDSSAAPLITARHLDRTDAHPIELDIPHSGQEVRRYGLSSTYDANRPCQKCPRHLSRQFTMRADGLLVQSSESLGRFGLYVVSCSASAMSCRKSNDSCNVAPYVLLSL
jgi:hypothetical protein